MVKNDKWRAKAELESNPGENKIKKKTEKEQRSPFLPPECKCVSREP